MTLETFQQKTVEAAVDALTGNDGSRRFLIADEVGLGKTVSAKAIAAILQERRGGTLNVVYFCPNLDIASQNLAKLRKLDPHWSDPQDRLSLALTTPPSRRDLKFRIYSYTPDTSIPGWKPGQRTGRMAERDVIGALLRDLAPALWNDLLAIDRERERRWFSRYAPAAPAYLARAFEPALRELTGLAGKPLADGLKAQFDSWQKSVPELILRCRAALALAALRHPGCRPDLLILDEFHRYADLILPPREPASDQLSRERHFVQRTLVDALIGVGSGGPALLLLSATPYRLRRVDHGEIPGGRYGHFIELVRFLYGPSRAGEAIKAQVAIDSHHRALLRRDDSAVALSEVATAKQTLERLLRPVIARTERATAISGELFNRCDADADVRTEDLVTFRHLARAVASLKGGLRSWVQPLWSSVPYPAETLFQYKICKALGGDLPPVTIASSGAVPAHPQLRALVDPNGKPSSRLSLDALALPWVPPTRSWWCLNGPWADVANDDRPIGKALLFSRYRGTPAAVSTWLSNEVERRSGSGKAGAKKAQSYLRPDAKAPWPLIALFMPFPALSGAFEPARGETMTLSEVRRRAYAELKLWLEKSNTITIVPSVRSSRKPWRIAFDLEELLGNGDEVTAALRPLNRFVNPKAWRRKDAPKTISRSEVRALANWMLGAPGMVIARTLRRHSIMGEVASDLTPEAFRFCWARLRPYLGQRYFARTILGARKRKTPGGYPELLRQTLLEGGFEAVLDEHVAVTKLIGDASALKILSDSLVGHAGRVRRRTTRGVRPARVHAATPYLGAERRRQNGGSSEKLRSDLLRKGFNSPFWPHVLATTSIGQEGLDFHVWCDRVVHWDLPRDPVDFEQREGRVSRYASLGVRRALADKFYRHDLPPWTSPFETVFARARSAKKEGLGLERWWSPTEHKPVSVTFAVPFSRGAFKLKSLKKELVTYRLALGQPEPRLFEEMIAHFNLDQEQARKLALNLSPSEPVT